MSSYIIAPTAFQSFQKLEKFWKTKLRLAGRLDTMTMWRQREEQVSMATSRVYVMMSGSLASNGRAGPGPVSQWGSSVDMMSSGLCCSQINTLTMVIIIIPYYTRLSSSLSPTSVQFIITNLPLSLWERSWISTFIQRISERLSERTFRGQFWTFWWWREAFTVMTRSPQSETGSAGKFSI